MDAAVHKQHVLLSAKTRTVLVRQVMEMTKKGAFEVFIPCTTFGDHFTVHDDSGELTREAVGPSDQSFDITVYSENIPRSSNQLIYLSPSSTPTEPDR